MKQDFAQLLSGVPETGHWLLVDSSAYLPLLCQHFPEAGITAVTRFDEVPALREFAGLNVDWHVLDYRQEPLPFAEASFDCVLAVDCLDEAYEVYDTMLSLSRLLTDVGTLYTRFTNIRYGGLLTALQQGQFPVRQQHLYAKTEIVRILNDALFKEIHFLPGEQDDDESSEQKWQQAGFDNFSRDLATRIWLVRAVRSTASVANLKGLYDKQTRASLARILHRIEYDIDREKNLAALNELCEMQGIFPEYLKDFIQEACSHPAAVMYQLSGSISECFRAE